MKKYHRYLYCLLHINFLPLPKNIIFSILLMKRASQRLSVRKVDYYRKKSPSAIFKPDQEVKPKRFNYQQNSVATLHIAQTITDTILQIIDTAIQGIQEKQYELHLKKTIQILADALYNAYIPAIEQKQVVNSPQDEPMITIPDHLCGCQRLNEVKRDRKCESVQMPSTPIKEMENRVKNIHSTKQIKKQSRKNSKLGLIPLNIMESQTDLKTNQIQTFYRQKYARQDDSNNEQIVPKLMQTAGRLKKINVRQNQQFNFDYNGDKIAISNITSLKKNHINVLKTIYKVHKDRQQVKNHKKLHESIQYSRLPGLNHSSKSLQQNFDLTLLKRGIERNVNWKGKLASIKLISQVDEPVHKNQD